jgi:CheY-like chemotaxis protein
MTEPPRYACEAERLPERLSAPVRVLVVDDNAINREVATHLLESFGMQPVQAFDGAEAVRLVVDGQAFDLVLMDIQMPVMNGLEATARIRQLERERALVMRLPIVALTAESIPSDEASLQLLGLDGVLAKPLSVPALESCLERWCPGTFQPS